jgi:hypothetical protein
MKASNVDGAHLEPEVAIVNIDQQLVIVDGFKAPGAAPS